MRHSIVLDTASRLGISNYMLFLQAYKFIGVADPESLAREDFKRFQASGQIHVEEEVVDFCLTHWRTPCVASHQTS